jgi:hypothetical protein
MTRPSSGYTRKILISRKNSIDNEVPNSDGGEAVSAEPEAW